MNVRQAVDLLVQEFGVYDIHAEMAMRKQSDDTRHQGYGHGVEGVYEQLRDAILAASTDPLEGEALERYILNHTQAEAWAWAVGRRCKAQAGKK